MFFSKHPSRVLTLVLVGCAAAVAGAQSPDWPHASFQAPVVVAPPEVLPASFAESLPPVDVLPGSGMWSVGAPHLVLRPHAPAAPHHAGHHGHAASHRQNVAGPRPALPGATTLPLQKTPYSYGYFGAVERRHWSLHFGHQQNYTQWRQR